MKMQKPRDVEEKNEYKGVGFPQILHDRSRNTGNELFRLLISLSTGTLGIYFFALTTEAKPPLTELQQVIALLALSFMAIAVLSGIVSMHSDSRRNYYWACALQPSDKDKKNSLYKKRDLWIKWEYRTFLFLATGFCGGILSTLAYMVCRVIVKRGLNT
jgi:hypothetical protein